MTSEGHRILTLLKTGTTEYLILAFLCEKDTYGYEISSELHRRSRGLYELQQGFLYPALKRMVNDGLVESYWKQSARGGPKCKYYTLTEQGALKLEAFVQIWREFDEEFNRLLALSYGLPADADDQDAVKGAAEFTRKNGLPVLREA